MPTPMPGPNPMMGAPGLSSQQMAAPMAPVREQTYADPGLMGGHSMPTMGNAG